MIRSECLFHVEQILGLLCCFAGVLELPFDSVVKAPTLEPRVKALVTILFSLALVLSHWPASAASMRQLCQGAEPCGCGDSTCCMQNPGSETAPASPAPANESSRASILAAVQALGQWFLAPRSPVTLTPHLPVLPVSPAVPLFQRDCSYLI